jgi:hypothetical protein
LAKTVRQRALHACEYCRMPQAYYPTTPFPIDHIIARHHGGLTVLGNLALSGLHDNSHKGPVIAGLDPLTRKLTKLFNPRRHRWDRHFLWNGPELRGRTAIGRTTIIVLVMNHRDVIAVRRSLIEERLFPAGFNLERKDSTLYRDRSSTYREADLLTRLNWSSLTVPLGNLATISSSPPSAFTIRRRVDICMSDCHSNFDGLGCLMPSASAT